MKLFQLMTTILGPRHWEVRVFYGDPNQTMVLLGRLVMQPDEYEALLAALIVHNETVRTEAASAIGSPDA